MEQDARLHTAMQAMCNNKMTENGPQREWFIADIAGFLRDERYDELDALYNQALAESFTCREAEKRYFRSWWTNMTDFYDMDAPVKAGPDGLALIKNWQRARPHSTHAWLAEAQYWNNYAWLYRSYGWARETTHAMWICAAACNEQMVIAALNAIHCEPRQWMAAALTSTNSKVFGQPTWLVAFLQGEEVTGQPIMQELARYRQSSPQETDALMAHSGLSFDNAICPSLPRPSWLPACKGDAGQKYWLSVCQRIFPTAFYALDEYIPFRMPRWRGSHEEIREFLASSVCAHLSPEEREHLELLIWWDDYRDLRIKEIDSSEEQERVIAKAREIALHARSREARHNALGWLMNCYDDLENEDALWRCIQLAVMEKRKLNNYFTYRAVAFALRDFPDTNWIYNFICQNSQQTLYSGVEIYRGYFQYAGLFGFEKNEKRAKAWLDKESVNSIECSPTWNWTIRSLHWLKLTEHCVPLAELGAQRNIPGAMKWLGQEHESSDDNSLLPYEPATALDYYQRAAEILRKQISLRDSIAYPLVSNGEYTQYEDDLGHIYVRIAMCYKWLIREETSQPKRFADEKKMLDYLYQAHQLGREGAWRLYLLNIFEVKDYTLAHARLDMLHEEADKGSMEAMVTLSRLYGNKQDKKLFNMKQSARWYHFAKTLYPDSDVVWDCLAHLHGDAFWKRCRYAWLTLKLSDAELPGRATPKPTRH
ncbi:DUF4034 domain-containing protein [Leminorella grimontii]|uniref:DUF4034 domain-containing protein n=1 Tax=Leminorella grimontii TaxID=82981 RepID=UPI00321F8D4B